MTPAQTAAKILARLRWQFATTQERIENTDRLARGRRRIPAARRKKIAREAASARWARYRMERERVNKSTNNERERQ